MFLIYSQYWLNKDENEMNNHNNKSDTYQTKEIKKQVRQ